jgi:hypothetical protein
MGFYWWQLDITHVILRVLSMTGLIWGLRRPPERVLDEGRRPSTPEPAEPNPITKASDSQRQAPPARESAA